VCTTAAKFPGKGCTTAAKFPGKVCTDGFRRTAGTGF
jgi:hypothetical protein